MTRHTRLSSPAIHPFSSISRALKGSGKVAALSLLLTTLGMTGMTAAPAYADSKVAGRSDFSVVIRVDDRDDRSGGWDRRHWDDRRWDDRRWDGRRWDGRRWDGRGRWEDRRWDQRGWEHRDWRRSDWSRGVTQPPAYWCPNTRRWIAYGQPGWQPSNCHFVNRQIWQHGRLVTWQERVCY